MIAEGNGSSEAGFTLVEAIVAMVVFMFGILAISNLFIVALQSNVIANQATTAAAQASEVAERLKALPFGELVTGGDLTSDLPSLCDDANKLTTDPKGCVSGGNFNSQRALAGAGIVNTRWTIQAIDKDTLFLTIRSEVRIPKRAVTPSGQVAGGAIGGAMARAEFTTFRTCTNVDVCP